jgi:hypothetical protein
MPRPQRSVCPPRLLLVNPRFPESFWSFRWAVDRILPGKRTVNPPLGLATLGARYLDGAQITLSLEPMSVPHLLIRLRGRRSREFFDRAVRHMEHLLGKTQATLTLRIDRLRGQEAPHFRRLLARLSRHGDRISIVLGSSVRALVPVDSSVFHLVLEERAA